MPIEITQEYAVLLTHFYFQSAELLAKIHKTQPGTVERDKLVFQLEALKECLNTYISESREELKEAFRKEKASKLIKKLGK